MKFCQKCPLPAIPWEEYCPIHAVSNPTVKEPWQMTKEEFDNDLMEVVHWSENQDFDPKDLTPGGADVGGLFVYPIDKQIDWTEYDRYPFYFKIPKGAIKLEQSFEPGEFKIGEGAVEEWFIPSSAFKFIDKSYKEVIIQAISEGKPVPP